MSIINTLLVHFSPGCYLDALALLKPYFQAVMLLNAMLGMHPVYCVYVTIAVAPVDGGLAYHEQKV